MQLFFVVPSVDFIGNIPYLLVKIEYKFTNKLGFLKYYLVHLNYKRKKYVYKIKTKLK